MAATRLQTLQLYFQGPSTLGFVESGAKGWRILSLRSLNSLARWSLEVPVAVQFRFHSVGIESRSGWVEMRGPSCGVVRGIRAAS